MRHEWKNSIRRRAAVIFFGLVCLAAALLPGTPATASGAPQSWKILIMYHEAGWAAPANRSMYAAMRRYFDEHSGREVTMYAESMDLSLFQDEQAEERLVDFYRSKYRNEHIDVLVPVQGPALHFLMEHRGTLFTRVPVVYMAPAEIDPFPGEKGYLTGVTFAVDIRGTVDLVRKLHPNLEQIALVGGTAKTDRVLLDLARRTLREKFGSLGVIHLEGLPMDETLQRLGSLPGNTAVLYLPVFMDGTGQRFVPAEALEMVARASIAPVYCIYDAHLGHGCVGGSMMSYEMLGARTAELVIRVLSGEKPGSIRPVLMGDASPMFDWRELRRWKIPESSLPGGSRVFFREQTLWERGKWYFIGVGFFSIAEFALIAFLLVSIRTRRRIEQELRESELSYRTVAQFTYAWEYWIGPDGIFRYNSPSCERVTGYASGDFMADPGLRHRIVFPEDREVWHAHRHEKPVPEGIRSIEFRIRRKDGEIRWIEHSCLPVHDASGSFLGYRASNSDITERKLFEVALAASEADLKRAHEMALIGGWRLDIPGRIFAWSEGLYEIFGLPKGTDLKFEDVTAMIHPDDCDFVRRSWSGALRGEVCDIEHRILVKGGVKWVRSKAGVEFSPEGEPLTGIGIMQDITRRKLAEEEQYKLRESLAHVTRVFTMGELTTTLAHEINQPLAAILANAQAARHMLDENKPDIQELKDTVDDIISDDKRAREVVQRTRAIMKKETLPFEQMTLESVIRDSLELVDKEYILRDIRIKFIHDPGTPPVRADRVQLQQVVINLLVNAMEATIGRDERLITIRTSRDGDDQALVSVQDTGRGINGKAAQHLFEPFYTTKPAGLGLGLSISRSIIEAHGGRMFASPNPGQGATFSFSLPAAGGNG